MLTLIGFCSRLTIRRWCRPGSSNELPSLHPRQVRKLESTDFFVRVLGPSVRHQIHRATSTSTCTGLKSPSRSAIVSSGGLDFRFGINIRCRSYSTRSRRTWSNALARACRRAPAGNAGASLERKKMYLKCPNRAHVVKSRASGRSPPTCGSSTSPTSADGWSTAEIGSTRPSR